MEKRKVFHHYRADDPIYQPGDKCRGIYCVHSGSVVLRHYDSDGKAHVSDCVVGSSQVFGYGALFAGRVYVDEAVAAEDSVVCFLESSAILEPLRSNAELCLRFLRLASTEAERLRNELEFRNAPSRAKVAHLILLLKEKFGCRVNGHVLEIHHPFGGRTLSEMAGLCPETLTRVLREYSEEGVAEHGKGIFVILDPVRLNDEVS
jgi:CRP-like cAMP-binding protein